MNTPGNGYCSIELIQYTSATQRPFIVAILFGSKKNITRFIKPYIGIEFQKLPLGPNYFHSTAFFCSRISAN